MRLLSQCSPKFLQKKKGCFETMKNKYLTMVTLSSALPTSSLQPGNMKQEKRRGLNMIATTNQNREAVLKVREKQSYGKALRENVRTVTGELRSLHW